MSTTEELLELLASEKRIALQYAAFLDSVNYPRENRDDAGMLDEIAEIVKRDSRVNEGCEYCKDREPILDEIGELQIDDSDGTLWFIIQAAADDIYEDHTNINYCPMCGRRLKEAAI